MIKAHFHVNFENCKVLTLIDQENRPPGSTISQQQGQTLLQSEAAMRFHLCNKGAGAKGTVLPASSKRPSGVLVAEPLGEGVAEDTTKRSK